MSWLKSLLVGNWLRKTIGILSVAAAVGLLIWSIGFVTTSQMQNRAFLGEMLGDVDCWVKTMTSPAPKTGHGAGFQSDAPVRPSSIPDELIAKLKKLEIADLFPVRPVKVSLDYKPGGRPIRGPKPRAMMLKNENNIFDALFAACRIEGRMPDENSNIPEIVLSTAVLRTNMNPPQIGETISLISKTGTHKAAVVGIVHQKKAVKTFPSVFANSACLQLFAGRRVPATQLLLCSIKDNKNVDEAIEQIDEVLLQYPKYELETKNDQLKLLNESLWNRFAKTAPITIGLSLTIGICMIFSVLYISIQNRTKLYCILRTIGTTRGQLVLSVLVEAVLMGILGVAIGILFGYISLKILVSMSEELYPFGVHISSYVYISVAVAGILITVAGAILPSVKIFKIKPLDYIHPSILSFKTLPIVRVVIGLLLIIPSSILAFPIPIPVSTKGMLMLFPGIPMIIVGLVLSAPIWILIIEKFILPVVAWCFGLKPSLVAYQLSRNLGRTIGGMITLTAGLGLYIAIQIWGASMLAPFMPDDSFPDGIISFLPMGISQEQADRVKAIDCINSENVMDVAADQFVLDDATLERLASNPRYELWQNNVLIIGVTPEIAFRKNNPFCDFNLVHGDDMSNMLINNTNGCIITETFARHGMLQIGDLIGIKLPGESQPQQFKVEGIIKLNWHMITSRSGMRSQNGKPHRTLGPVFINQSLAKRLINKNDEVKFIWFDYSGAFQNMPYIQAAKELTAKVNHIAASPGLRINVSSKKDVTVGTLQHAEQIIGAISKLPFYSLIFLSLGMLNMIVASISERKNELLLMRSIGMTQGQLFRIIACDTLLLYGAGVLLSLAFGLYTGWIFAGWSKTKMAFGGLDICFIVPWLKVFKGIAFALCSTLIISIPAILIILKKDYKTSSKFTRE